MSFPKSILCHHSWWVGGYSDWKVVSEAPLVERAEVWVGMGGKSGSVEGELASDPLSDTSEGVRWMLCEKHKEEGDSGVVGLSDFDCRQGTEQVFRWLKRGISIFCVRGISERGGSEEVVGKFLWDWDTAIDVLSVGETRRERDGDSWVVGLEVARVRDRGLGVIFKGFLEL